MNLFPSKKKNWEQIYRTMESQQDKLTRTAVLALNPAVVQTVITDELKAGEENELHAMTADIGGFGVDLCRILNANRYKTMCAGFEYSNDRKTLEQFMQALSIPFIFAPAMGKMRSVVRILSKEGKATTLLRETGWKISDEALSELQRRQKRVLGGLKPNEILIVGGSVQNGVPDTIYRDWIRAAKEKNLRTVLCAEGKLLKEGLGEKPTAVILSKKALEESLHKTVTVETLGADAKQIAQRGIEIVCVYDEDFNLRVVYEGQICAAKVSKGAPMNRPGAVASIVAGVVMAMVRSKAPQTIYYVQGVLKGTLSKPGNSMCTAADFEKFYTDDGKAGTL